MAYSGETTYFANKGTLTVGGNTIAVVKDVEITVSADHVPLYGWGTIKRVAVARHSLRVAVKVGFAKFGMQTSGASPGWFFSIVSPTAGSTATGVEDTNSVKLFTVIATFTGENGDLFKATISNVFFPNFPTKATEGAWMRLDLDGEGSDVVYTNV